MKRVALLGLGQMGTGIAERLFQGGFHVSLYNRTPEKAKRLAAKGAGVAKSPAEAAQNAEVIISMVADDDASREVWLGNQGAMNAAPADAILVECSTLSLGWIRTLTETAMRAHRSFLDAPVNGGPDQAAAGELRMMVGGAPSALEKARLVLKTFTSQIEHMGENGAGALTKLIHNMLLASQISALAEGLTLAERGQLKLDQVVNVIANSGPGSPAVKRLAPLMASGQYGAPSFPIKLVRKDVIYALKAADELGLRLRAIAGARQLFDTAAEMGLEEQSGAAIIEALRKA